MSCTASQQDNIGSNLDFRLLLSEGSDPDSEMKLVDSDADSDYDSDWFSISTNSSSDSDSDSDSTDVPLESTVVDNLNDLERLLTRINLMTGRDTAYPRSTLPLTIPLATTLPNAILPTPTQQDSQKPTWHSLPTEIHLMIYHHYFDNTHYVIHNPSPTTKCPTRPASDTFWKDPTSLSRKIHASHINLFLASREIISTAHPIWLSTSTFSFGRCIVRRPEFLWRMPRTLLTQIKTFQTGERDMIYQVKLLAALKLRLEFFYAGDAPHKEEEAIPSMLRCICIRDTADAKEFLPMILADGQLEGMKVEYIGSGTRRVRRE